MPTSYLKQCQQENVNLIRKYVWNVSIKETITSTTYTAEITIIGTSTIYSLKNYQIPVLNGQPLVALF
jgi:hypothetical protein